MGDDHPKMIAATGQIEPVPRRVRAMLGDEVVLDTVRALYVWEWPNYPQYYIPLADITAGVLTDENHTQDRALGTAHVHGVHVGDTQRARSARVYRADAGQLADTVRFDWDALDSWYEEDEEVFVHPRNPYVRVDALRSTRHVQVALEGVVLAESTSPVMVFETGLPTRYYLDRTDIDFRHLLATSTQTKCPYKGTTTNYWSITTPGTTHADLAWSYNFPTRQLLPIAGLVAFYNERVDITLDRTLLPRPKTHFFS